MKNSIHALFYFQLALEWGVLNKHLISWRVNILLYLFLEMASSNNGPNVNYLWSFKKENKCLRAKFLMLKTRHEVLTDLRYATKSLKGKTIDSCNSHRYKEAYQEFLKAGIDRRKVASMIYGMGQASTVGLARLLWSGIFFNGKHICWNSLGLFVRETSWFLLFVRLLVRGIDNTHASGQNDIEINEEKWFMCVQVI